MGGSESVSRTATLTHALQQVGDFVRCWDVPVNRVSDLIEPGEGFNYGVFVGGLIADRYRRHRSRR